MSIEIFLLHEANTYLLSKIAEEVFDEPIQAKYLQAFLHDPRHLMYLAVDRDTVVGMISGVEYFHPDKPPQLWINEVGVALSHRRQGIGRELVQSLIAAAEARGCVFAWLGTAQDNLPAQACFNSVPDLEKPQPFLLYEWDLLE